MGSDRVALRWHPVPDRRRFLLWILAKRITQQLLLSIFFLAVLPSCRALPDLSALDLPQVNLAVPSLVGRSDLASDGASDALIRNKLKNTGQHLQDLAVREQEATGSPLIAGNRVTLLTDGPQTFAAMMKAIHQAREHIHLETYIFDQDEFGLHFADMLIEKQLAGVQVKIIYDSVGTLGTPASFFQRLREAGIKLIEFNPVNPLKRFGRWRLNNRDHRKILVVDGNIAFTGGVNIARDYAASSLVRSQGELNRERGWRDTHVQIEGPAVAAVQLLFMQTWEAQHGAPLPALQFFPNLKDSGSQLVRVLGSAPDDDFDIYKAYYLALQQARKTVHITVAYFAPDQQLLGAIINAARRGVDVQLILPSMSDAPPVFYAGRSYYRDLLSAGVKISEFQPSVLHAKTAVIDGAWSTVGSANLDMRSALHNSEINVIVLGEQFGRSMEAVFARDLRNSRPVTIEDWERRPWLDRIREWAARQFAYFL